MNTLKNITDINWEITDVSSEHLKDVAREWIKELEEYPTEKKFGKLTIRNEMYGDNDSGSMMAWIKHFFNLGDDYDKEGN